MTGDTVRLDQFRTIADINEAATGTVRLRDDTRRIDIMTLDTASTKTSRRAQPGDNGPAELLHEAPTTSRT